MDFAIDKVSQIDGTFKYQIRDIVKVSTLQFDTWKEAVAYLNERVGQQEV